MGNPIRDPEPGADEARFKTFRSRDAISLAESKAMDYDSLSTAMREHLELVYAAGASEGAKSRLLFKAPGFSLTHVWFKSGFPVTLHSHSTGCLYYITAGSIRLGGVEYGVGDGFFVSEDVPYAYTAGPNGVEVLEFRNADKFDLQLHAKGRAYWEKAASQIAARRAAWSEEPMPSATEVQK